MPVPPPEQPQTESRPQSEDRQPSRKVAIRVEGKLSRHPTQLGGDFRPRPVPPRPRRGVVSGLGDCGPAGLRALPRRRCSRAPGFKPAAGEHRESKCTEGAHLTCEHQLDIDGQSPLVPPQCCHWGDGKHTLAELDTAGTMPCTETELAVLGQHRRSPP
jgi:hypothetical protein